MLVGAAMYTEKHSEFRKKLVDQESLELQSAVVYLRMACWFRATSFQGAADYLYKHAKEEFGHAEMVSQYVADRFIASGDVERGGAGGKEFYPLISSSSNDLRNVNPFGLDNKFFDKKVLENQNELAKKSISLWESLFAHEKKVTAALEALSQAATRAEDDMAVEFVSTLLREQREEERVIGTIASKWKRNPTQLDLLDHELANEKIK
jgi:ferritin